MAGLSFGDLGVSFAMNVIITIVFLLLYSLFKIQPLNARVFFTKWFSIDDKKAQAEYEEGTVAAKGGYLHALDWMADAVALPERELIAHAGLDVAVYLRMFKLGFKIFVPIMVLAFIIIFPTNYTSNNLQSLASGNSSFTYTDVDKLTVANIPNQSHLLWVHWACAWAFYLWILYCLRNEYQAVAQLRLDYLSAQKRAPNQYSVLVRQVPDDHTQTVAEKTAHFFSMVHRDQYLLTQPVFNANKLSQLEAKKVWTENKITSLEIRMERFPDKPRPTHKLGSCGCSGEKVDSLEYYQEQLKDLQKQVGEERDRVVKDKKAVMPAAFVSFRSRWGAAVAAQTQQSKDNTKWITTFAPEQRDVAWSNLPINYTELYVRKYAIAGIVAATILFYYIPISFVQGLANLSSLEKAFPWLQPVIDIPFINSFLQGFLPGLALKVFLAVLPYLLMFLSQVEGYVAYSEVERAAAGKFFYFMVFTVFLANVLVGSAWSQIQYFINNPAEIPATLGNAIPTKATFFMTYTMLDAWAAVASEVVRIAPLVIFHLQNRLLVRTPEDRVKAMAAQGPQYVQIVPQIELYFLLPLVYCIVAPLYLPFALVYYMFAFVVYRNQFINVYVDQYELAGGYWPHFHNRVVVCMLISQLTLIGVFGLKQVVIPTILLLPLPLLTILYHLNYIDAPFANTFRYMSLEEAMRKDTIDQATNPDEDPHSFLARAYLHPSLMSAYQQLDEEEGAAESALVPPHKGGPNGGAISAGPEAEAGLVPVKRHPRSRDGSPAVSASVSSVNSTPSQRLLQGT